MSDNLVILGACVQSYIDIFQQLPTANVATVVTSAISITVLALNNELLKVICYKQNCVT